MSEAEYCADEAYIMVMRDFGDGDFYKSKKTSRYNNDKEIKVMENNKAIELPKEVNLDSCKEEFSDLVYDITKGLDDLMLDIDKNIIEEDSPSIEVVEKYMTRLSGMLFFIQEDVERLGMDETTSKLKAQEKYNLEYQKYQAFSIAEGKKATVKELEIQAENNSLYESTQNEVYSKAYKLVKGKVTAVESMLHVLNKIYSYRVEMAKITSCVPSRVLNEGV